MKCLSTDLQVDTRLASSAASPSLFTPSSHTDECELPLSSLPPLAGKSYVIKRTGTNEAIALVDGELRIQDVQVSTDMSIRWLCVERGTHFGLYNQSAGTFIGHDGRGKMVATRSWLLDHELLSTQYCEGGGYELQTPHWWLWKRVVDVAEDGRRLIRTEHGRPTLWVLSNTGYLNTVRVSKLSQSSRYQHNLLNISVLVPSLSRRCGLWTPGAVSGANQAQHAELE